MSIPQFTKITIACQGGGSHCAFTSGVLAALMRKTERVQGRLVIDGRYELVGLSGTSGGAIGAYLAWTDLLRMNEPGYQRPRTFAVERFWERTKARLFPWPPQFPSPDLLSNWFQLTVGQLDGVLPLLSPSPNPVTALAQRQLREAIEEAAGLSSQEQALVDAPLKREHLESAGPADLPVLMIGAANIDDCDLAPFVSTPGNRPKTEQLLASAALPDLYPAVVVNAEPSKEAQLKRQAVSEQRPGAAPPPKAPARYWDGLLSQNPPLGDFLSLPLQHRPDEIWIIRINPAIQASDPLEQVRRQMLPGEIRDRRNELAGNLSLEQEKRFIRKINKLVEKHHDVLSRQYQTVKTFGIALEGPWDLPEDDENVDGAWRPPLDMPAALKDLDANSKMKRFAPFIDALVEHGRVCCAQFLAEHGERGASLAGISPPRVVRAGA